ASHAPAHYQPSDVFSILQNPQKCRRTSPAISGKPHPQRIRLHRYPHPGLCQGQGRSPILKAALLVTCLLRLFDSPATAKPAAPESEIVIRERTFIPAVISLTKDELVTLIIKNEDHDLHAFVPLLLFQGLNVMVTGNGAPEFNETGFARVLIPPRGQAEIRFRPATTGRVF